VKRRPTIVTKAWSAELRGLNPAPRPCHLLERAHAAPGIEQVCSRDKCVVTGADEDNVGSLRKFVHVTELAHLIWS